MSSGAWQQIWQLLASDALRRCKTGRTGLAHVHVQRRWEYGDSADYPS